MGYESRLWSPPGSLWIRCITCPNCGSRWKLDEAKVPDRGAKLTCPRCKHRWVVHRPPATVEDPGAVERDPPPPPDDGRDAGDVVENLRELGIEGTVVLKVQVRRTGDVRKVKIVKGIGHGCNEVAAKALRGSRFKPAIATNGQAADYELRYEYEFQLDD